MDGVHKLIIIIVIVTKVKVIFIFKGFDNIWAVFGPCEMILFFAHSTGFAPCWTSASGMRPVVGRAVWALLVAATVLLIFCWWASVVG